MQNRHSSPAPMAFNSRPETHRKRSNSLPMVEALGCSTAEAELILAEGRAAVRSRHAPVRRRSRQKLLPRDETEVYRPRHHLKYLNYDSPSVQNVVEESGTMGIHHTRIPSDATDVTVVGPTQPLAEESQPVGEVPGSPLEDYSATLAKFIRSQLNSIPTYQTARTTIIPRSCPDLAPQPKTPPQSPTKPIRRPIGIHSIVEIPPIRPPLQSAFSAWSSTDDDTDEGEDENEVPPMPTFDTSGSVSRGSNYSPSILRFYENSNESSFLFTSTPLEEEAPVDEEEDDPLTAKGVSFPNQSELPGTASPSHSLTQHDDYPSSAISPRPQLSSSSAPSLSSISTASYFDCKRPMSLAPNMRARIIAAVTPNYNGKIIPAISPFEDDTLTNVHNILVESQHRLHVDGMSFDMLQKFKLPEEGMMRVPTPC